MLAYDLGYDSRYKIAKYWILLFQGAQLTFVVDEHMVSCQVCVLHNNKLAGYYACVLGKITIIM